MPEGKHGCILCRCDDPTFIYTPAREKVKDWWLCPDHENDQHTLDTEGPAAFRNIAPKPPPIPNMHARALALTWGSFHQPGKLASWGKTRQAQYDKLAGNLYKGG